MRRVRGVVAAVVLAGSMAPPVARGDGDVPIAGGARPARWSLRPARVADADPPAVALDYRAPRACADRARFVASVRTRAPRAHLADDAATRVAVEIRAVDGGFEGELTTPEGPGRAMRAPSCDDLVAALALVTALAIDPTADPSAEPPPSEPQPPPRAPRRRAWHAVAELGLAVGLTPGVMPMGRVGARVGDRPGIELTMLGGRDRTATEVGDARFTWVAAQLAACWRPALTVIPIAVDACAHVTGGALDARGTDVVRAQAVRRAWFDAGLGAVARWPRAARGFAELRFDLRVPWVRDRFVFEPDVAIHQAAWLIPSVGVGAGVRFR